MYSCVLESITGGLFTTVKKKKNISESVVMNLQINNSGDASQKFLLTTIEAGL